MTPKTPAGHPPRSMSRWTGGLGSAAAHAGRTSRLRLLRIRPDSVLERMRGVRFDSAGVVAVCSGQRTGWAGDDRAACSRHRARPRWQQ